MQTLLERRSNPRGTLNFRFQYMLPIVDNAKPELTQEKQRKIVFIKMLLITRLPLDLTDLIYWT